MLWIQLELRKLSLGLIDLSLITNPNIPIRIRTLTFRVGSRIDRFSDQIVTKLLGQR